DAAGESRKQIASACSDGCASRRSGIPGRNWASEPSTLSRSTSGPSSITAWRIIGVSVTPGDTALTRMSWADNSSASTRVRWATAALLAQYADCAHRAEAAVTEAIVTIEPGVPSSIITRAAARTARKVPVTFTRTFLAVRAAARV